MNASFANNGNYTLVEEGSVIPVDGTVSISEDNLTVTIKPTSLLTSPTYTATLKGDPDGWSDKAGNRLAEDYTWSFNLDTPTKISMTLDNTLPKWGHDVTANGNVTGARAGDKISIDWGDGSTFTEITPVPAGGQFTATHVYDISALSPYPAKVVVAKLLSSVGVERARTEELSVTLQKHATSLTVAVKPTEDGDVCASCPFTIFGKLVDIDTTPNTEVGKKTITFAGTGVTQTLNSIQTEGVTFTGTQVDNLTLTSSILQMPEGSEISLPSGLPME